MCWILSNAFSAASKISHDSDWFFNIKQSAIPGIDQTCLGYIHLFIYCCIWFTLTLLYDFYVGVYELDWPEAFCLYNVLKRFWIMARLASENWAEDGFISLFEKNLYRGALFLLWVFGRIPSGPELSFGEVWNDRFNCNFLCYHASFDKFHFFGVLTIHLKFSQLFS